MTTKSAKFAKTKETKNTIKFDEIPADGEAPIIGSLYVKKHVFGDKIPEEIAVRIDFN
jgi:hypothetical protein